MPLYPYRCTECGHRFEKIQSFSAKPLTECPKCGGALERPLTAPALKFVGSGWYANDYGVHAGAGAASDSSSSDKKSEKSESKAAGEKTSSPAPAAPASTPAVSTTS